jgi:hypothetical protein
MISQRQEGVMPEPSKLNIARPSAVAGAARAHGTAPATATEPGDQVKVGCRALVVLQEVSLPGGDQ